jgi:hypothetical protein
MNVDYSRKNMGFSKLKTYKLHFIDPGSNQVNMSSGHWGLLFFFFEIESQTHNSPSSASQVLRLHKGTIMSSLHLVLKHRKSNLTGQVFIENPDR